MKKLQLIEDMNISLETESNSNCVIRSEDNFCHLFKHGIDPIQYNTRTLLDAEFLQTYHSLNKLFVYKDSDKLCKMICSINPYKILKCIIDCFLEKYAKKDLVLFNLSVPSIYDNIVWDKYLFKIKFIKHIRSSFKPEVSSTLVSTVNFPYTFEYLMTPKFISYYNNVMSGRSKMPLKLLQLIDIHKLIYIRANLKPLKI